MRDNGADQGGFQDGSVLGRVNAHQLQLFADWVYGHTLISNEPCIQAWRKSGLTKYQLSNNIYGTWRGERMKFLLTPGNRCQVRTVAKVIEACGFDPVDFDV